MTSTINPQWQEKASELFSSSGSKLKQASASAKNFVGEVAKDASGSVAGMAEKVGTIVKNKWSLVRQARQQIKPGETMPERLLSAATTTSTMLKKGISETKDKVVVGRMKVEEVAKKTADKSKIILSSIERWQKGVASNDVFGVPIEVLIQRQQLSRPIPQILVKCADYLILSGLHTENLFKSEGDKKVIQQLVSMYNQDFNASLPEGTNPIDVAALVKCYLASLPEPLTTFELYYEIKNARSNVHDMRNILNKLPNSSYMTLEYVTALLLHVSQKSSLNKVNAHILAIELAPLIMWQKGDQRSDPYSALWRKSTSKSSLDTSEDATAYTAWDTLSDEGDNDVTSLVSLDDGEPPDFSAIEVVQCLIEHHNAVFTYANETTWG